MVEITKIATTKRGRYALFVQDEFLFSIDEVTMAEHDIYVGRRLRQHELDALRDASDLQAAQQQALRYLAVRAHGKRELYEKLLRRYDAYTAENALAKIEDMGLVDDESYAHESARILAEKGKSPLEIGQKLQAVGIDRQLADEAVRALGLDSVECAVAVLRKKYTDKLFAGEHDKVAAALARRGFSYGEIKEAMEQLRKEGLE